MKVRVLFKESDVVQVAGEIPKPNQAFFPDQEAAQEYAIKQLEKMAEGSHAEVWVTGEFLTAVLSKGVTAAAKDPCPICKLTPGEREYMENHTMTQECMKALRIAAAVTAHTTETKTASA